MQLFACTTAIYVGDDATDEDAFRAVESDSILGIRIGPATAPSSARFHLESQSAIDTLLRVLVDLRATQFIRRPIEHHRHHR